jgi:D-glycero-alpha-D-manno-heptose-7-phosphate kinase
MEIEAAHLKSLTGRQDHLAALRGGLQGIRFSPGRVDYRRLPPGGRAGTMLRDHAFLAHTGIAHLSSDVNWRMIRGAIDGDGAVLRKFRRIAVAAKDAWEALSAADPRGTGAAIAAEWTIRKTLAPGVSTAGVEALLHDRRFRRRVSGAKLCGAGGGGMLFGLLRDPADREAVEALLSGTGMSVLPFRLSGGPRFEEIADAD